MHEADDLIVFKLSDMKHPIAGRLRRFKNKGRWTQADYAYIHRGDGKILAKYSFGFAVLKTIDLNN